LNNNSKSANSGRDRFPRGAVLAVVLVVIMLAALLVFSVAGSSIFHLTVSTRLANEMAARQSAESVIAMAVEKIVKNQDYGRNGEMPLQYVPSEPDKCGSALLSFVPADARRLEIPCSTWNLKNDAAASGWKGRVVPRNSVHLVGTGVSCGVKRSLEAIIYMPPFPYAIASSGTVTSNGNLVVASVKTPEDFSGVLDPKKLLPADLASNSTDSRAITLKGEAFVTGNLQTAGDVEMEKGGKYTVLGEIKRQSDTVSIPTIDIESYDPESNGCCQSLESNVAGKVLEGYYRSEGSVNVAGDLELNGSLVYVKGDLTVNGKVKGKGALVVAGRTTISNGANVSSDNLVALMSKSDVTLGSAGSSPGGSTFQGIVYTEGNLKADSMNLYGIYLASGKSSSGSSMELTNTSVVHVPSYTSVSIPINTFLVLDIFGNAHNDEQWSIEKMKKQGIEWAGSDNARWLIKVVKRNGRNVYCSYRVGLVCDGGNYADPGNIINYIEFTSLDEMAEMDRRYLESTGRPYGGVVDAIKKNVTDFEAKQQTGSTSGFSLDLNKFLKMQDRLRILYWGETSL